ncbi:trehalose-phosphatase [Magnetospirillum sp. UT-4]|uniref:trehalose-phosphatase n=1 Tax=Magnetospirillum sp. UT-4 TaxID=2681467 RepID=UPI00137DB82C|nr:trehalose-phosphatase [Magnetospirillum sp. UT-4]CAA7611325.1 putative trehalose-phosphate phosphatase [Magnetospirillum sp. UT-4]
MDTRLPPPPPPARHWAWLLDIDGTLIDIAPTPSAIDMPVAVPQLLQALSDCHGGAVALVSGRALENIRALVAPFDPPAAGLHGLERRSADGTVTVPPPFPALADIRRRLAPAQDWPGVLVEDKGLALAVHYRLAPEREGACRLLVEGIVADHPDFAVLAGKMVLEVKPAGWDKGGAVRAFMAEAPFAGRMPVFVGDDVTDEAGFEAANALGGLSVLVGDWRPTAAGHYLPDIESCRRWLAEAAGSRWSPHAGAGGD